MMKSHSNIVSFGKKPRKSKTSEIIEIEGLSFYLYNTKSSTKGITEVYFIDGNIYPLIVVAETNEKAKLWLESNITRVKSKIASMAMTSIINRDEFHKPIKTDKDDNKVSLMPSVEELQLMHNEIIKSCQLSN